MKYRHLGRTGVKVSELCLGAMTFGDVDTSCQIIDHALEGGINFIDTANVYGRGRSEDCVGEALKRNGQRDRIVLATKVHGRMADDDPLSSGNSRRHILQQCDASLRRLQTDWIDLYQIHRPQPDVPIDETLRALDDLVRAGKVRYLGSSTFGAWQVADAQWVAKELGLNRFVCEQPPYHLLDRRIERELLPACRHYGLGVIPWSPLASGMLTGKYRRGEAPPEGSRLNPEQGRGPQLFRDAVFDVVEAVEAIAEELGKTPSQTALAWCRDQPGVTSPIIGPKTLAQLEDHLGATGIELTEAHHEKLNAVSTPGGMLVPFYEADFRGPQSG